MWTCKYHINNQTFSRHFLNYQMYIGTNSISTRQSTEQSLLLFFNRQLFRIVWSSQKNWAKAKSSYMFPVCACVLSRIQLFVTPWTKARQTPLCIGFSRQEYWSGLPFPSPGDLSDPGMEPPAPVTPALIGRWILYHWVTWGSCPRINTHTQPPPLSNATIQATCFNLWTFINTSLSPKAHGL